ncbi:MAG: flagellar hook-associated protein FlgK [Bdellovibrionota bacterium]
MGIPNIFQTGRSGMVAHKAAIATTGHNISNTNTDGYSRQRVQMEAEVINGNKLGKNIIGNGTKINRVERINDLYVEKQLRYAGRDMAHMEEKNLILSQTEDIFNEMNGEGLNRLVSRFFNEFRKLSNEPENEAMRQSVREASSSMVNDFHRLRNEVEQIRANIDIRLDGYSREVTALSQEVADLNQKIRQEEILGGSANDLRDKQDVALKKLSEYMDLSTHPDKEGSLVVEIRNVGPLVSGNKGESFSVERSPADGVGKPENGVDLRTSAAANGIVTHAIRGGKMGALLEVRDKTLSTILDRLDELAYTLTDTVNEIHTQGFTRNGFQNVDFFKKQNSTFRAAEFLDLSDAVKDNVNNISTAAQPDSPGDNRIAIAISGLQGMKILNDGNATFDAWYNSIVSDVGVATNKNRVGMNQQKDIMTQLGKMRDQISGVSIDEETANLMQYHQAYDASAKVIQVADEMLKTVLELKRY